jgi:poly(hydroxyalkanoate) depolymerase family esterase
MQQYEIMKGNIGDFDMLQESELLLTTLMDAWTALAFGRGVQPSHPVRTARTNSRTTLRTTGHFSTNVFRNDVGTLRYKLYVPASYDGTPMPLVVMLHGCRQNADDFARGTAMNELAEQFGCLIVYPEQSRGANWHGCWQWFDKAHHERDQGEPALIAGVTRQVIAEYAVDRAHVGVAGLSAGGAMAVIMGRTYPDLFTAVGCHSGLAHGSATSGRDAMLAMRNGVCVAPRSPSVTAEGLPIIVFHGDRDKTVHLNNSDCVVRQSVAGRRTTAPGAAQVVHSKPADTDRRAYTRTVHRGAAGEVLAEQWTVHGAGHAWSGGSRRGSYTDADGPDASREMLRFFIGER